MVLQNDFTGIGIRFQSNPKLKHVRFPSLETISSSGVQVMSLSSLT